MSSLDPTTLAVVRGAFEQIAEDMDAALVASALSPVIADAWDRASGVFHPTSGEVIVQGATGMPIFVIVMQHTVQEVLCDHDPATMRPGDVFIVNDPYRGGTHTMDVKFVKPYFRDGDLAYFVANTGHWPDVGSMTPGGFTTVATDVYQEGLRLPPVKIYDGGILNQALLDVMMLNMRIPEERAGDMAAQLNALDLGCRRLDALFERFDVETLLACVDELRVRSEKQMRSHIESIPDGTYSFGDVLDSDGVDDGPIAIELDLTVRGSEIIFDLSRTAPACRGPFNSPWSSTLSALAIGVRHVFPDVPINAGCFEPFRYVIPEGSLLNPRPPSPVSGTTTETAQRLIGVVMGALAQAVPDLVPAGAFGTGTNICIGGRTSGHADYATIFFFGGGYGGSAAADGLTNGATLIAASRNSSIEVLEHTVPLRFNRVAVREGSAGDGTHRGGFGVEIDFELRDGEAYVTLVGDRGVKGAYGLFGGGEGRPADHEFHVDGRTFKVPHQTKIDRLFFHTGDGVTLRTPGGGGYGDPAGRAPHARRKDMENGYISEAPDARTGED